MECENSLQDIFPHTSVNKFASFRWRTPNHYIEKKWVSSIHFKKKTGCFRVPGFIPHRYHPGLTSAVKICLSLVIKSVWLWQTMGVFYIGEKIWRVFQLETDGCLEKNPTISYVKDFWLVVSTPLKKISQNGFIFPNFWGENRKYLSCHHPDLATIIQLIVHNHLSNGWGSLGFF